MGEIERTCQVCGAVVATFPEAMACHCVQTPWQATPSPSVGDGVERAAKAISQTQSAVLVGGDPMQKRAAWRDFAKAAIRAISPSLKEERAIRADLYRALETLEAAMRRDMGAGYAGVALAQAALAKAVERRPVSLEGE